MQTYAYGFPRLGTHRQFKRVIEGFWDHKRTRQEVFTTLEAIASQNNLRYHDYVDIAPSGEMSLYDPMLDTAVMVGVYNPCELEDYYRLCRGQGALEMTKWFNTNYHYLVPDLSGCDESVFYDNTSHFSFCFKRAACPVLIGPFTFLKLSKGLCRKKLPGFMMNLAEVYRRIISEFDSVQIDEPAFCMDLEREEIDLIKDAYGILCSGQCRITLMTYYESVSWLSELMDFNVSAIGLDFVHGQGNMDIIRQEGFPLSKKLIAGLVDGRNVWKNDIAQSVKTLRELSGVAGDLAVSNAAPLFHLPVTVRFEEKMAPELRKHLCFAEEKILELVVIASCYDGMNFPLDPSVCQYGQNPRVQYRVKTLTDADFVKTVNAAQRRKIHQSQFHFGLFPVTTIGSFPQTEQVRAKRAEFASGKISPDEYDGFIRICIDNILDIQHALDLDVFVHGEFERSDMVEFFAQKLEGIASTAAGWVISYGTRVYRPPIIYGDVCRKHPMSIAEVLYAQSGTEKPVKGMLTGPVTIMAWSFVRQDIAESDIANQIALALRDEICDYERVGVDIVQVDEPAFREKAPLKKRDWGKYFKWAVRAFNLATNTMPTTQIHTHMCYSRFGPVMEYINKMDFDVISIEAARSGGDVAGVFRQVGFDRQIGLGVWDIHSTCVPDVESICRIIELWMKFVPKENLWINPDCGLKTRDWPETLQALKNIVLARKKLCATHTDSALV